MSSPKDDRVNEPNGAPTSALTPTKSDTTPIEVDVGVHSDVDVSESGTDESSASDADSDEGACTDVEEQSAALHDVEIDSDDADADVSEVDAESVYSDDDRADVDSTYSDDAEAGGVSSADAETDAEGTDDSEPHSDSENVDIDVAHAVEAGVVVRLNGSAESAHSGGGDTGFDSIYSEDVDACEDAGENKGIDAKSVHTAAEDDDTNGVAGAPASPMETSKPSTAVASIRPPVLKVQAPKVSSSSCFGIDAACAISPLMTPVVAPRQAGAPHGTTSPSSSKQKSSPQGGRVVPSPYAFKVVFLGDSAVGE